jgi:hypothetical protein
MTPVFPDTIRSPITAAAQARAVASWRPGCWRWR